MKKHSELWTIDCETDPFEYGKTDIKPFIWGAYDGVDYHQFETAAALADFFRPRDAVVYAHNGGKFDFFFMFDELEPFSDIMVINGRLSRFEIGESEFRDSWNILPFALSAYQKDDINYDIMKTANRHKPENWRKICDYLKSDVKYLWQLIHDFREQYGTNLTLASSALAAWRKITKNKNPKSTRGFYNEYGQFYYGGRVECFEVGIVDRPFKVIDINSAYPNAMCHDHPYGTNALAVSRIPRDGVERCFITLECDSDGALPYRDPKTKKLTFPHTRGEFNITGWEYIVGKDTGTIRNEKIKRAIIFDDKINFKPYVDHFFALKEDAAYRLKLNPDNPQAKRDYIFAKLFLNSLYGKLAANPEEYTENQLHPLEYADAMNDEYGWLSQGVVGNFSVGGRPLPEAKQNFFNVATAASITGFVRAQLFEAISQCDTPLYCDTDSIACVGTGELELHPTRLGAWDVEADCVEGAIAGKKLYAFKTSKGDFKIASKGARLTPDEVYKVAQGNEIVYTPIAPTFSLKNGISIVERRIRRTG